MRPGGKKEVMEFIGARPKNQSIVSRVRDHGYMSVMFNNDDFIDAVVWATNVVYEYNGFFSAGQSDRVVIPMEELPFLKLDVENSHFLLLIYYNMRKNYVLVEQMKQSLYTLARFQKIDPADIEMMKRVDKRMAEAAKTGEYGFNFNSEPELEGGEKKYHCYSRLVTDQIEKYREECAKAKV
jgi:hypothetical protein